MINLQPPKTKFVFLGTIISFCLSLGISGIISWHKSLLSYQALTKLKLSAASSQAQTAKKSVELLNFLSLNLIPDLKIWRKSLDSIIQIEKIVSTIKPDNIFNPDLKLPLTRLSQNLTYIEKNLNRSLIYPQLRKKKELSQYLAFSQDLLAWVDNLNQADSQFVVWLQNSEEIRASGGFVGSVAVLEIKQNQLQQPFFLDIYDLAGQTQPIKPRPAGIKQYLSEGKGMSITDANWHPDFTQAVRTWLSFLPESQQSNLALSQNKIQMVAAINLNSITNLLKITGPIYLPDYELEATADNLSTIARSERDQFFAGDHQKKQFLVALFTQLKLKLSQLNSTQTNQLKQLILTQLKQGEIQLYASQPKIQKIISAFGFGGQIKPEISQHLVYLIESNVGINKANQQVTRQVKISIKPKSIKINLNFTNQNQALTAQEKQKINQNIDLNQADHLAYINYQRLITNLGFILNQVTCGDRIVETDVTQITDSFDQTWQQIGFLSTTAEQSTSHCQIKLKPRTELSPNQAWLIKKQPGLKTIPYQINWFGQEKNLLLERDELIQP